MCTLTWIDFMNSATAHTQEHHNIISDATRRGDDARNTLARHKIIFAFKIKIPSRKKKSGRKERGGKWCENGGKKSGRKWREETWSDYYYYFHPYQIMIMTTKLEVMKAARLHRMGGQAVVLVSEKGRRWRWRTARQPELERSLRVATTRGEERFNSR